MTVTETDPQVRPFEPAPQHPLCGVLISMDVASGTNTRCTRNTGHEPSGHDNGGARELEQWLGLSSSTTEVAPVFSPGARRSAGAVVNLLQRQIRTYESTAHWKRERGLVQDAHDNEQRAAALRHVLATVEEM